jgi:hypothetical protein
MSETIIDDREMLQVRLWARVIPFDVRDPKACAEFGGHTLPAGYGTLQDPRTGKPIYAHRLSGNSFTVKSLKDMSFDIYATTLLV